jgi:putative nucleotidyltransferase with HDIG domain
MSLGKAIYGAHAEIMLARGVELSQEYIDALATRGFTAVYVQDGIADDVEPLGPITERLRASSVQTLATLYELMAQATQSIRDQAAAEGAHVISETPMKLGPEAEAGVREVERSVENLLDEALGQDMLAGLTTLKAHDSYTFEHSVDVAIYGAVLGSRLGLDRSDLRDLTLGCMVHDIGKMYVDERILTKPGKLSTEEFSAITQHTVLGFAMLRQLPLPNGRPAHVALQHHEKQDGSGYPHRLFGNNRVFRSTNERFDVRRISLFAEIAAVADVCSALASDRPYRAALPTPEVLQILREMAGPHLNKEIVEAFVRAVQPFPVGTHIAVRGGRYDGCLGIVVQASPTHQHSNRPGVRLLLDPNRRHLAGVDVELWTQPSGVGIDSIREDAWSAAASLLDAA